MAGDQHPLYLTSSIVGGGSYGNFTGETIFAGGLDSYGGVGVWVKEAPDAAMAVSAGLRRSCAVVHICWS